MSGRPKFSVFRPWVEPSPSRKTNGDRLRLLTASDGDVREERKANVKLAVSSLWSLCCLCRRIALVV
jgi:hypothetical protein